MRLLLSTRDLKGRACAAAVLLSAPFARAQTEPAPSAVHESQDARLYFNAGARAYAAGKYPAAVRAFEEAYRVEPRPGLVFSIAQAYRRQYFLDRTEESLRQAIEHYRHYLDLDPEGARRGDTAEALSELEPLAPKLSPSAPTTPSASVKPATQLMISSPIEDVSISLDGSPAGLLPYIAAVTPGVHHVTLAASGYATYERDVRVLDGSVVPLDVTLAEKPAKLTVVAPAGARIAVNGRLRAVAPAAAIELPPGRHFVTVTENGHEAYSRELSLGRDEARSITASLPGTSQRTVAWVFIGTGATAVLAGGGLLAAALVRENSAKSTTLRTKDDILAYDDAVASRNELRTAGIVTGATGLALGAVGVFLFAFDEPRVGAAPEETTPERRRSPRDQSPRLEVSASPWFSPGSGGATLKGSF